VITRIQIVIKARGPCPAVKPDRALDAALIRAGQPPDSEDGM
jgi:hypothetical protein